MAALKHYIYIASTFANREYLRYWRDSLEAMGHTVIARWLDIYEAHFTKAACAEMDYADIRVADLFILDNVPNPRYPSKGGKDTELGYVQALGQHIIWLVGPRTTPFMHMAGIRHFTNWHFVLTTLDAGGAP